MAVVNTKSTAITNADATQRTQNHAVREGAKAVFLQESVAVASGDDDGSTYRMLRLPSNAIIKSLRGFNTAVTGGTDYDLGIYQTAENGGAVVDKDVFADGASMATASLVGIEYRFNATATVPLTNVNKRLWELLGLTEDPQRDYDLVWTANTVGSADGTLALQAEFVT